MVVRIVSALIFIVIALVSCGDGSVDVASENVVSEDVVGEGTRDTILSKELNLGSYNSKQSPDKIIFTIVVPPSSGQLEISNNSGKSIDQFTQADITAGRVEYKHERSALLSDYFVFDVDDGQGNILSGGKVLISIVPNVTMHDLEYDNGSVTLSWDIPASQEFSGIEVWRRESGDYSDAPSNGVLVGKPPQGHQQLTEAVIVDVSKRSQSFYYTIFSYGENGVYSDGVNVGLYCDYGLCVSVPDLRELNSISTKDESGLLKDLLINKIWSVDTLPNWMPTSVAPVSDVNFSYAQSIQKINVQMDYGIFSEMWLFSPLVEANGKLVIYHQGHSGSFHLYGLNTIQRLLQEGFHVLGVSMPLLGMNQLLDNSLIGHGDLTTLDRPMRFFLEPISVALNYVTANQAFSGIYMTGLSGGGWTTVVYSAIDERITASYPVAGSYPFYLRNLHRYSVGDFEQYNADFYQHVSFIELYILGATGRRQLQIFNEFDDCCFAGTYSSTYEPYIQSVIGVTGGAFDVVVDETAVGHELSDFAIEIIINDILLN